MRIYNGVEEFERIEYPVVTSGTFDGVHLGHQKILEKIKEIARQKQGETVLLTFWPHPKYVLNPQDNSLRLLTTFQEKAELLQAIGIKHVIKIPFTPAFSQMTSHDFVQNILVERIGTKQLVIGYNHRFGKNREGSFQYLQENASSYGFQVVEIPRQDVDHVSISSTKIREYILNDQIHLANKLLGRPYGISGQVVKGQQIGRNIGFPTANIEIAEDYKLIPSNGAYAVQIHLQGTRLDGMMNIGVRPTLGEQPKSIEVNIFDFHEDIYHQQIRVDLIKQIRQEVKFEGLEQLTKRLQIDQKEARAILNEHKIENHDQ